jgi:hypothetical protein
MSNTSLKRQVRQAYNQNQLARVCTLREDRFGRAFGMETVRTEQRSSSWYRDSGRPEDYYHFRNNGSRVLAVAHLDTVVRGDRRAPHFRHTERGPYIRSGALDDRLGAYVILHLLPAMGITCDWLLTVGEESGMSTAESFKPGKDYDWAIEFDRGGTDVVMYQYEDRASRRLVEASGARMGSGSFSDIAYLEHLGVKAFNWGVGYDGNYHSEAGYAYLNNTFAMVAKYLRFHEQNAGTAMPHKSWDYGIKENRYGSRYYSDQGVCEFCGQRDVDLATWYCGYCGLCADCGATNPQVAEDWGDPDVDVCMCYVPAHAREAIRAGGYSLSARTDEDAGAAAAADDAETCPSCGSVSICGCAKTAAGSSDRSEDARPPFPAGSWPEMSWGEYLNKRHPAQAAPAKKAGLSALSDRLEAAVEARNAELRAEADRRVAAIQAASSPGKRLRDALDSPDWHPEQPCPGCAVCTGPGKSAFMAGGAVHVIPPHHITSRADNCPDCWHPRYVCDGSCAACVRLGLEPGTHTVARHVPGVAPLQGCPRCAERDQMLAAIDRGEGWHAAAEGIGGVMIMAHEPAQGWAGACKRCAARWPAPLADSAPFSEWHAEAASLPDSRCIVPDHYGDPKWADRCERCAARWPAPLALPAGDQEAVS